MIRLLLSLLALVSGLAAQGAPAQALCAAHDMEIGAPAPAQAAAQVVVRVVALAHRAPAMPAMGPALPLPAAQIGSRPGVLIGIDRALN